MYQDAHEFIKELIRKYNLYSIDFNSDGSITVWINNFEQKEFSTMQEVLEYVERLKK